MNRRIRTLEPIVKPTDPQRSIVNCHTPTVEGMPLPSRQHGASVLATVPGLDADIAQQPRDEETLLPVLDMPS